jgi:hypothetical protein
MLCSLGELKLTKNDFPYAIEDGIFIMEEPCTPGQDIKEVLGLNDTVFEFEITPNRPDCLSMRGLAREAAVTFGMAAIAAWCWGMLSDLAGIRITLAVASATLVVSGMVLRFLLPMPAPGEGVLLSRN